MTNLTRAADDGNPRSSLSAPVRPLRLTPTQPPPDECIEVGGVPYVTLAWHEEREAQWREALDSRDVIGQAKGILMATEKINADEAFHRLRMMSQTANRKLVAVVRQVVDDAVDRSLRR